MAKKKKILLLSDDLRMTSGIATVSKEFVFGTMDKFHWVQLGAAVKHPEQGKEIDLGADVRKETGIEDASLKIIPWTGYGDANVLRQLIMRHQPDAILHFTDPRYWRWLYEMEAEIRENIPILFYHIWDDLPDPKYNRDYYESCDWLGCISKQTYGIVSRVGKIDSETIKPLEDWQVDYVPHGINPKKCFKTEVPAEFKKAALGDKDYKFVLFWMNRNIRRKQPSDVIWAYKKFVDGLSEKTPIDLANDKLIEIKLETLSISSKLDRFPVNVRKINKLSMKDNEKSTKKITFVKSFLSSNCNILSLIIILHVWKIF